MAWTEAGRCSDLKITGFTLIELLVVMAIVVMLAALALPTLAKMTGRAQDTKSLNNLSMITKALLLYATDNGAFPVSVDNAGGGFTPGSYWTLKLWPYLGQETNTGNKPAIFNSPNEKSHNGLSDYGVNGMVMDPSGVVGTQPHSDGRLLANISRLSQTVMISDARAANLPPPYRGSWLVDAGVWLSQGTNMRSPFSAWPPRNSGNKVFAAFFDGRVESISGERWATDRTALFDPSYVP